MQVQGQAEQGRVLLVSVPYAFKAHEAETLGGLPASAFVKAPPTDGSGNGSTGADNGTSVNALGTAGKAGGTAAPGGIKTVSDCLNPIRGAITLWSKQIQILPPIWELCNSNLFQVLVGPLTGNIGIGNTNPSKALDVGGPPGTNGEINARQWYDIASPELAFAGVGFRALILPNNRDTFVGVGAGTIIPLNPLANPTPVTETDNTFLGYYAGSNTRPNATAGTGIYNTFSGSQAGLSNIIGSQNTFTGALAGFTNTGNFNTFTGEEAGYFKTTGDQNTFSGYRAGYRNYNGTSNAIYGVEAGHYNNGSNNVFVGAGVDFGSLPVTTGSNNTFAGYEAGNHNKADNNVFYGYQAGVANLTGRNNAFYGFQAGRTNTVESNNVYLAHFGVAAENNTMRIGMNGGIFPPPFTVNRVFMEPILSNPNSLTTVVTFDPGVGPGQGQLGYRTIPAGGVGGGCSLPGPNGPGTNYITKWLNPTTVECSHVWENSTPDHFVGIGNTNPSKALDVGGPPGTNGEINARQWYDIGSPETPVLSIGPTVNFGNGNLFVGAQAGNNTEIPGGQDTFVGYQSGFNTDPTAAFWNTFVGFQAGYGNTPSMQNSGSLNTYIGWQAGIANTTGGVNVFTGSFAGVSNTTGSANTFEGYAAGFANQDGQSDTCTGYFSCVRLEHGLSNSFYGSYSGAFTTTGSYNSFFGDSSGDNNVTGSSNIYIGSGGNPIPSQQESNVIRIGTKGGGVEQQNKVFIEPILANPTSGQPLVSINVATGQLGIQGSSRRFKEQIADMGDSGSKLFQLRPVTFFYKPQYDDGSHHLQYGLIAEEVAKVYPEMVAYDKDGQPFTVLYQMLAPMLLRELQKEHSVVTAQQDELQTQLQQIKTQQQQMQVQRQEIDGLKLQLQQQNASLQERLTKLESYVATQMKTASDNPPPLTATANGVVQ